MGIMSGRKASRGHDLWCKCCPGALRSSSRKPHKRYNKILTNIFNHSSASHRHIIKLCEYAANNPSRIPKIAHHLEQRILPLTNNNPHPTTTLAIHAYTKLLSTCQHHMPYFALSLLNVVSQLLHNTANHLNILGSQMLTTFIYSQADATYAHNIECLVSKICMMSRETGDDLNSSGLRASSLQCISSMIWFMAEFSHIFTGLSDIVHVTLDNYEPGVHLVNDGECGEAYHNWVDEVVRSETRDAAREVSSSYTIIRPRPEKKNPSQLTREEIETPKVWAQICISNMVELAKETTTMRQVLDPMFIYFDIKRQWVPQQGLSVVVLTDMLYLTEGSGNEQSILSAIIRHLEHKNVAHNTKVKSDIVRIVAGLARQFRSEAIVVEAGIISDLCRHLTKSLQVTVALSGGQETNLNILLQNSIEDCLVAMVKGVGDSQPLCDIMASTMEKHTTVAVAARVTFGSMFILAHIISLASSCSHSQQVFPEALLLQLLKAMIHSDAEARIVAHQIFSVILVPTYIHPRQDLDSFRYGHPYQQKRPQTKNAPVFASAAALLEKLRRDKGDLKVDNNGTDAQCDQKGIKSFGEEAKLGWIKKNSPNFCKISYNTARADLLTVSTDSESSVNKLSEDQIAHLLSAFWIQACLPDNTPSNFEAISHSFKLTIISSYHWNTNQDLVPFFQLPLSLRKISLDPNYGMLPPSCQISLFVLATVMLMSEAKIYQIPNLYDILKASVSYDVDPYLGIDDDQNLYLSSQANGKKYGSSTDHKEAINLLSELRKGAYESDKAVLDIIVQSLPRIMKLDGNAVTKQLLEDFKPDDPFLFGSQSRYAEDHLQALFIPKESLSFDWDSVENGTNNDDAVSESSITYLSRFIPKCYSTPSFSHVISVAQLLESAFEKASQAAGTAVQISPQPYSTMTGQCEALGTCTRDKLSNWLEHEAYESKLTHTVAPTVLADGQSMVKKISSDLETGIMRLPPASPFDNFLRAVDRKVSQGEIS